MLLLIYWCLGEAIAFQALSLSFVVPDHMTVAAWCYRQAAEVHNSPVGMTKLAPGCYIAGAGVTEDYAQAAVWLEQAVDLGDAAAKATLGDILMDGDARYGVAKDAARGFTLSREAADQGYDLATYFVAECYLQGAGVEKDAVHGVSLLRQVIKQKHATKADAERALAICYMEGNGVEADTVQAALWCQQAIRAAASTPSRYSQSSGSATSADVRPPASCATAA